MLLRLPPRMSRHIETRDAMNHPQFPSSRGEDQWWRRFTGMYQGPKRLIRGMRTLDCGTEGSQVGQWIRNQIEFPAEYWVPSVMSTHVPLLVKREILQRAWVVILMQYERRSVLRYRPCASNFCGTGGSFDQRFGVLAG